MNFTVKIIWMKALRGTRYDQGEGQLRVPRKRGCDYCVLGVLCELYRIHTGKGVWDHSVFEPPDSESHNFRLPTAVRDWAELDSTDPLILFDGLHEPLSVLNDKRISFKILADLIEKQL